MRSLIIALGIVFLGGCSQYQWVKPGATPADFQRDDYACRDEAARLYPPQHVPQPAAPGAPASGQADCRAGGEGGACSSAGAQEAPAATYVDENEKHRRFARWDCLSEKGWELVRVL